MSENKSIGGQPVFEHDCNSCVFLGQYDGQDLYFHRNEPTFVRPEYERNASKNLDRIFSTYRYYRDGYMTDTGNITILARHGSDGDYFSYPMPTSSHFNKRDWERVAIDRAIAKGYMLPTEESEEEAHNTLTGEGKWHVAYDECIFRDGGRFDEPWFQERYEKELKEAEAEFFSESSNSALKSGGGN